jgi:uncharacterized protein YpiB (UPF0302 family)
MGFYKYTKDQSSVRLAKTKDCQAIAWFLESYWLPQKVCLRVCVYLQTFDLISKER